MSDPPGTDVAPEATADPEAANAVRGALARYVAEHPGVTRWCVAYSGGRDSHALLHVAAELLGAEAGTTLRAVHVDHALHVDSGTWAHHVRTVAKSLGVPLVVHRVQVEDTGEGPEAAARAARHAAFAATLEPGEHLLLAQHARDQAETFLLRALRGSGPYGLAAIPRERAFAQGVIARPLLECPPAALAAVARQAPLAWIEDPSNADVRADRNFLRHEILPRLERRWPAAERTLGRTAGRCAAAGATLAEIAREDLGRVRVSGPAGGGPAGGGLTGGGSARSGPAELGVSALRTLPRERAYAALRLWVREAGLRAPRLQDLAQMLDNLVHARAGSGGIVSVRGYEFRRHADRLYLLPPQRPVEPFALEWRAPFDDLAVPGTAQVLTRAGAARQGLALPGGADAVVTVRSRAGGERLRLGEPPFHKALKKLLQESGVPPWRRGAIPLLYIEGRLAAVWDVVVAVDCRVRAAPGNVSDECPAR